MGHALNHNSSKFFKFLQKFYVYFHSCVYTEKHGDKLNEFIVVTQEKKEFTVILITGRLDRDDLKGMIHQ